MATDLEASRLMVRHGANCITNQDPNYTMYCAMAKKFATDKGNANKELMYEHFCKDTKTDLMKTFDMQTLSNPITDIVDAYYIAKCGYENIKSK